MRRQSRRAVTTASLGPVSTNLNWALRSQTAGALVCKRSVHVRAPTERCNRCSRYEVEANGDNANTSTPHMSKLLAGAVTNRLSDDGLRPLTHMSYGRVGAHVARTNIYSTYLYIYV